MQGGQERFWGFNTIQGETPMEGENEAWENLKSGRRKKYKGFNTGLNLPFGGMYRKPIFCQGGVSKWKAINFEHR